MLERTVLSFRTVASREKSMSFARRLLQRRRAFLFADQRVKAFGLLQTLINARESSYHPL